MERLIYKEEQWFRQSFMLWLMIAALLLAFGGIGVSLYQQLYLGKPAGDNPMSNNSLILTSLFSFVLMTAVFLVILSGQLVTEIWSDGIRYKFTPLIRKIRFISLTDISSVEVAKYKPLSEFGGYGWRRRLLSKKTAFNIKGSIGVRVIKKNGSQVLFGTQHEAEMKRAVEKMLQPQTNKYFS
jgi:hypothetical protein